MNATMERGVVIRVADEPALDRVLAVEEIGKLLLRRLSTTEALLKDEPKDRKVLASLREQGIHLQGP